MALPHTALLTYTAKALGGITPTQLKTNMEAVPLYGPYSTSLPPPPPPNASQLPTGTSDAVFDVLFGASVLTDVTTITGTSVSRVVTLGICPAEDVLASSFVSLGNAGDVSAPTNNPPFPSSLYPFTVYAAGVDSEWIGCVVSSSPNDSASGTGAQQLSITYDDTEGHSHSEVVTLDGTTPVNLVDLHKYIITQVTVSTSGSCAAPFGQINIWSGLVDPVTGLPTGRQVGYVPNSYFTNFSFQQLTSWAPGDLADGTQAYQLLPPDYSYPNKTVTSGAPPPSKSILNYPPPSSITNPSKVPATPLAGKSVGLPLPQGTIYVAGTGGFPASGVLAIPTSKGLQTIPYTGVTATSFTGCTGGRGTMIAGSQVVAPYAYPRAPNFATNSPYLGALGLSIVPNPFQGLGLLAFSRALNMPTSNFSGIDGTVSMSVSYS